MVVGQAQCWGSRQPPQTRLPRSRPTARFTKLYTCLTILSCFVDRTVSYEMRVHGLPNLVHPDFASSESSGTYHEDASQRSARSDSTVDTTSAHFESMMNGMAQDIFHHPTEQNFYESNWQADFASWATNKDVQQRFFQRVRGDDDEECQIAYFPVGEYPYGETCKPIEGSKDSGRMDIFGFYALDVLGWEGLRCNAKLKGCENMPSTEYIRKFFFSDPHRARRVIYTIDSFRKIFHEYSTYNEVLEAAKVQVKGYCMDFANTFFHHDTFPEKRMCTAQIIQIVMGVIAAIVAILTLGQALYAMAPMLTAQAGGWYTLSQALGVSADQAFLMSGTGFASLYSNSMTAALNGVGQTILFGATSDVITSSLGIITTAGSVAATASAHHLEVKGGAASKPGNGDMMSGGAAGFIGLTAVADTIRIALGRLPAWDATISALTDEKFWEELGKLDQTTRTTGENVAKIISNIKLPNIPDWSKIKLSSEHLGVILQRASNRTSNILSQRNHVWLVESGRRAMMKDIPAWADNGAQALPTAEETEKIGKWMQTSLEDAIITGHGQAIGSQDLNEYIATQRRNFEDKRAATELTFRSTMSSFTRSSGDNNPLPEEWGSYGHLEWVPLRDLSFNPDGESPIYHQVKVKSKTFFKKYPENNSSDWSQNDRTKTVINEDTVDDLAQENVVRLTKLFTIYPVTTPLNATDIDTVSIYGLGPRIAWRMQDEKGRAFTAKEAWSFWDKHSSEIDRRVQLLRDRKFDLSDTSIGRHVPLKFPTTTLQVAAKTSFDTMSWTSLLGTVDFEGFTSSNAPNPNSPELRWRAKPSTDLQTRLGRRDAHRIMDGVAAHEIRGTLKNLEAMDLIRIENTGGMKKVKRDGGVHGRGDIFVAEVGENFFQTHFKRNACGTKCKFSASHDRLRVIQPSVDAALKGSHYTS
ncbi:hypothetical protein FB567DRAFT_99724 [Paraphoma chrysanthemicola]|uniref:Uncharacterized protein n=1 Tax=Paraphoma chrysanthemicola TaxID=798071 RepID=A0A8K0R3D1_9PLEO|nr:hypothetical protein FB567DRAFT_99724 [Paraphoma chrysanthemicola]